MWLREGWGLGVGSYHCLGDKLVQSCCFLLKMQVCCPSAWAECCSPDPKSRQLKHSSSGQVIATFFKLEVIFPGDSISGIQHKMHQRYCEDRMSGFIINSNSLLLITHPLPFLNLKFCS